MTTMKGKVVAMGDVQGGSFPQSIVVHADSIDELKQMPFLGRVVISREDEPPARQEFDLNPEDVPTLKLPAGASPTDITMQTLPGHEPDRWWLQIDNTFYPLESIERLQEIINELQNRQPAAQPTAGIDLDAIFGRLCNVTTAELRYAGRGSIDVFLRTEQDGTETWARYLEVFGPNVASSYKDPAPLDAESDFFMHAREDMVMLLGEVYRLQGDVKRIGAERDQMEAANAELQARLTLCEGAK